MSRNQFAALCAQYAIDPAVALENDELRAALLARNNAEVERILKEEF